MLVFGRKLASRAVLCGWRKSESPATDVVTSVVVKGPLVLSHVIVSSKELEDPEALHNLFALTVTPGQAGLPAEFKHINKRRKRNLQGFP